MKPTARLAFFLLWIFDIGLRPLQASEPSGFAVVLDQIISSPLFPNDTQIREKAAEIESQKGRAEAVHGIVECIAREDLSVDQQYAARLIGERLNPEFYIAARDYVRETEAADGRGRLIRLWRGAKETDIPSISPLLLDTAICETLAGEAKAQGGMEFRVCDIAHNVIAEVLGSGDQTVEPISRFDSFEDRDQAVNELRSKLVASGKISEGDLIPGSRGGRDGSQHRALKSAVVNNPETRSDSGSGRRGYPIVLAGVLSAALVCFAGFRWVKGKRR